MSIVNQMLQDLNARSANPQQICQDETFAPSSTSRVNPLTKYRIATGCFIITAVIIITYSVTTHSLSSIKADNPVVTQATPTETLLTAVQQNVQPTPVAAVIAPSVNDSSTHKSGTQKSGNSTVQTHITALTPSMSVAQVTQELSLNPTTLAQPTPPSSMQINTSNGEIRFIAGLQDKARLALQSSDMPSAIQALQALLAAKPFDHASRLLLSRLYYQTGQPDVALNLLQVAPNEDELSIDFLSFRVSLFTEASEHRYAINDYKVLSRLEPNNMRWQLGIAIAHDQLNDYADAKFAYEQVKLSSDLPTNVDAFVAERISILKDLI